MWRNKHFKFYFSLIIISTFIYQVNAQTGISSPYSSEGLGYLNNGNNIQSRSMGGIGIGTRIPSAINLLNPASLTAIDTNSFVFDGAVVAHYTTMKTDYTSEPVSSASLDHLFFGFPITKWWKSSIGLLPFSFVGYDVFDLSYKEDVGEILHEFYGEGGLSKFYWANSFQPIKNISIGINTSYIFGTTEKSQIVSFPDVDYRLSTKVENSVSVGDLYVDLGIQYYKELKNNLQLVIGATYNPKISLNATGVNLARTYLGEVSDVEIFRDTIDFGEVEGVVVMPDGYGFGFSLSKRDEWYVGADYKYGKWENFRTMGKDDSLVNSNSFAAGGQYTPDYQSNSFVNRVEYRLGGRFSQTYLNYRDTPINIFGITFGVGLPLRSNAIRGSRSQINIGFEAGRRGTLENGLVQENYFNFYLGVVVNELWFYKRRYQ